MYDVIIAGCGIIGASLAYELSRCRLRVLVLERENDVAMGTTRANSAIIHAGYDPEPGTLMARLNVAGAARMEELCRSLDVDYDPIGSLVLAFSPEEKAHLERLLERGRANGVPALELLTGRQVRAMEPNLSEEVTAGLLAPTAAIVDPWGLCLALTEVAVRNGVELRRSCPVTGLAREADSLTVTTPDGAFRTRYLVNCTGTHGHELAALAGQPEWEARPARGEYHLLDKSAGETVGHVIFQCPTEQGKGVLVAPTVHGNLIVGPNAQPVEEGDDTANTAAGLEYVGRMAKKSVPGLDLRQTIRTFAGVRARTDQSDFILRPSASCPRLLHLCGIGSPGLSAAPAIAAYAVEQLKGMGLSVEKKPEWDGSRRQLRFRRLSPEDKAALAARDPRYGRVICRCETITEGELLDAIHSPVPPCSVDGLKRRAGAGMGRCQGGFCGPRVVELLARELGCSPADIPQDGAGSWLLLERKDGRWTGNEV